MKRNYSKAIMTSALSTLMLATGIFASANSDWRPVRGDGSVIPPSDRAVSPFEAYRAVNGIANPDAKIQPAHDGLRPTPKVSQKPRNILRSPEAPRGTMYGIVNRHATMEYSNQAFVGKIDLAKGTMTPLHYGSVFCPYAGDDYTLQTNTYRNGIIYCPAASITENGTTATWTAVDLESGNIVDRIQIPNDAYAGVYSATYDADDDLFFTLGIDDNTGTDNLFASVDPNNNFQIKGISRLKDDNPGLGTLTALAYNPVNKELYAFDTINNVYTIDKEDGKVVRAGDLDTEYVLFTAGSSGQVCYSPADEMFVTIYRDNSIKANRILYIHPDTFEVFEGEILAKELSPYICAIFCTDDFAEPEAPEIAGEPVINFVKDSLTGTITFKAPTYSYVGVSLENSTVKTIATIDGKEVFNKVVTPGQEITLNQTLTDGLHELEIISYVGEYASPARRVKFFTGNDYPVAPAKVALNGTKLSWEAPGAVGANKGYVNTADLTYDVYMNNVKQNSEPIKTLEFNINVPEKMDNYEFAIVANANGKASEKGILSQVFGKAFELPFFNKPTQEQSKVYRTINANKDTRIWFWTDESDRPDAVSGKDHYGWAMSVGYTDDADDWLVLPLINFPSKDYLYTFQFDIAGVFSIPTIESYEIYLAKEPTVEAFKKGINIYSDNYYVATTDWEHKTLNFAVKEAGEYYIGIRINSSKANSAQGLFLNDFDLKVAEGKSTAVPGDPTSVKFFPDESGMDEFDAEIVLPTIDITGRALPADSEITVRMTSDSYKTEKTGKPGETLTLHLGGMGSGFAIVTITPENENGTGYPRSYRQYVGIDRPFCPTNIKGMATEDNLSYVMTWDAPGDRGENGGYVDVNDMDFKYNVYIQNGITGTKVGSTKETTYTFHPFASDTHTLATYYLYPSAENEGGESRNSIAVMEDLGDPYELPMKEEWGNQKFNYMPYTFLTTDNYKGSNWENTSSMTGLEIGDPIFIEGGIFGTATVGAVDAKMILPKFSTKGVARANFTLRYWDYENGPESIDVYARRPGVEEEKLIGSYKLEHVKGGEWVDGELPIPAEFMNQSWVQIRFGSHLTGGAYEYILADSYQILPDVDYDLKVSTVTGPSQISIGDNATYNVTVANSGRERVNGTLNFEIVDEKGNVYVSDETEVVSLTSAQVFEHQIAFEVNGAFANADKLTVRAKVTCANDENTGNDQRTLNVQVMSAPLPVVKDLQGAVDGTAVNLTWSTPESEYGSFYNFEIYEPFLKYKEIGQIGEFKTAQLDDLYPVGISNSSNELLKWKDYAEYHAWEVIDAQSLGVINDDRMRPHSGKQALLARCGWYDTETTEKSIQTEKWLIFPEIEPGSTIGFWWTALSSSYPEYIDLWESKTNDQLDPDRRTSTRCGAFSKTAAHNKTGADAWEFTSFKTQPTTKFVAIRYCSFDGIGILVDDISLTPKTTLNREIESYSVYRAANGGEPQLIAENVTGNSFRDEDWRDKIATYYVVANAKVGESVKPGPKSNLVLIQGSSVDEINAAQSVIGGKGSIRVNNLQGEKIVIATADGKIVKNSTVASAQAYYSLNKGIYVATVAGKTYKVVVR